MEYRLYFAVDFSVYYLGHTMISTMWPRGYVKHYVEDKGQFMADTAPLIADNNGRFQPYILHAIFCQI